VVQAEDIVEAAVVNEMSDTVFFMFPEDDSWTRFEAEAYHLEEWCKMKGFLYTLREMEVDV
jgi:hypothetical protein